MKPISKRLVPIWMVLVSALVSCGQTSPNIEFGKAECAHCRMNVVDRQFGAVLVTEKGRQYVFDDLSCMIRYVDAGTVARSEVAAWYVCDHAHPGHLIDATKAYFLSGPGFRSPMRGDVAAFQDEADRTHATGEGDSAMKWQEVAEFLKK